ncbi:Gibberellin 2-beta-dioxygenase [Actinidia chinensis var. chinensis]|uniref:gibberellin 2beta-dioxygenase n=2 Tax=Actinidia TaxID=3624 RepID=A0A7J0FWY7_9ERIC|nr:Gibberellin 2-beta-dioxygenase [Actinidia chinensis var. chinensis]GFZ03212.1 gibberellin 2-oxidase 3 [Actinidia rufa]
MVVLSQPALEDFSVIKTCKPTSGLFNDIPVIDLKDFKAKTRIVEACEEFGFFKVINHGVSMELVAKLESEAVQFFKLPQGDKDRAGPPNPFGYGNKRIGPNGDVGWVEYLLFGTNPEFISQKSLSIFQQSPEGFRCAVNEYISAVREMMCEVLEMVTDELKIEPRNVLSRMLRDEKSDSFFRLNHYPAIPFSELQAVRVSGRNVVGFGEHTDPQIISAVRSNNTTGLQISLRDGAWVSVPPDHHSFFINVGDSLEVMTNGRFKSVRHRVLADSLKSRVSMVYFGGPPLGEKITPLPSLMEEGEESLYKEFTWCEYKNSAYKTRLGDNRLRLYEKNGGN